MKKIGIMGLGLKNPYTYAPILSRMDAKVVAVYDVYPELVIDYADTFKCEAVLNIDEYPFDSLDGVIIDTKNSQHLAMANLALRHGLPVFIDKPLAPMPEDALAFMEKQYDAPWFSASPLRFSPLYQKMKSDLQALDEPVQFCRVTVYHTMDHFMKNPNKHWHDSYLEGGGMLVDIGIHGIELLNFFMDENPVRILYAKSSSHYRNCESGDSHHILFIYPSGAVGVFDLLCATDHLDYSVEVITLHHRLVNTDEHPYVNGYGYSAENAYGAFDAVMKSFLGMIDTGKSPIDKTETKRNFTLFRTILEGEGK